MADTRYVRGLDAALASMRRLREAANGPKLVEALNKGVEEMADRARTMAPVDGGTLRDSIDTDFTATPRGVAARVFVGRRAFYARYVEFGTVNVGARPFFWPAVRSLRKRAKRRVVTALRRAAREVARGGR